MVVRPAAAKERSRGCTAPVFTCSAIPRTQVPRMEHRLGARAPFTVHVRLDRDGRTLGFGNLRSASVSGAFVETSLALPLLTSIDIVYGCARSRQAVTALVAAYVTRVTATGVAVEWSEFAPAAIRRLLLNADSAENGSRRDEAPPAFPPALAISRLPRRGM